MIPVSIDLFISFFISQLSMLYSHTQTCATNVLLALCLFLAWSQFCHVEAESGGSHHRSVLIIVGAPGADEYSRLFREWADRWEKNCRSTSSTFAVIDGTQPIGKNEKQDRERIVDWIAKESNETENWIVLVGHGTSDRDISKFNLRGPDISANEFATEIGKRPGRWVIVNCASSSGPFINALSGKNRIVITATKSGSEQNFAQFGDYLSRAISDPDSDLDHDFSISILEAFLVASNRVAEFYTNEKRLASEQALLDDNGDKMGTAAIFFRGIRPIKSPAEGLQVDGKLASSILVTTLGESVVLTEEQRTELEKLEIAIEELRRRKNEFAEADYYQQLESIFLKVASIRGF